MVRYGTYVPPKKKKNNVLRHASEDIQFHASNENRMVVYRMDDARLALFKKKIVCVCVCVCVLE